MRVIRLHYVAKRLVVGLHLGAHERVAVGSRITDGVRAWAVAGSVSVARGATRIVDEVDVVLAGDGAPTLGAELTAII